MDAKTLTENLHRVQEHLKYEVAQTARLRECLEGMVYQFAHEFEQDGRRYLGTMGLSNLEDAFEVLGWDDPYLVPDDDI
jgi:hypothetical protein